MDPLSLKDLLKQSQEALDVASPERGRRSTAGLARVTPGSMTDYSVTAPEEITRVETMLRTLPETPHLSEYLAFLYYSAQRFQDAEAIYEALLAQDHAPARQHFHLGNCRLRQGWPAEARAHWTLCLDASPEPGVAERARRRLAELDEAS